MRYAMLILAASSLLFAVVVKRQPALTSTAQPVVVSSEQERFALDLANALGNTQPTADMVRWLVAWQMAENTRAAYNPLATSQDMPNATVWNSDGVKEYVSYSDGVQATAITLGYTYNGYADIREGIRTNDVTRAMHGLYASPWGTNAENVERIYHEAATTAQEPLQGAIASTPVALGGTCQANVVAALNANNGALQHIELAPGATFSFNASVGNPDALTLYNCAGVYGGAWCDLAARYSQVARQLGLTPQFQHHGIQLSGVDWVDSVAIWNIGGQAGFDGGRQDLLITNTSSRVVVFEAHDSVQGVQVYGY